ncbi:hypothetical protein FRB95_001943 [Tulasnella sp. JGI-2019a]|nr:hypothetical protein FRB95_001943 [Tulasnella sp. JGI-2019a]
MVRASTRSKTAASVHAAKSKASTPKKQAPKKAMLTSPVDDAPPAKPVSKVVPKPKVKVERKPTRTSPRKPGHSDPIEESVENTAEPSASGSGGDKEVATQPKEEDPPVVEEDSELPPPEEETGNPVVVADENEKTWCVCHSADDGTPMITCECCDNWFHFRCISLTESDAEEIGTYVCDACHESTGKSTRMTWEITDDENNMQPPVNEPPSTAHQAKNCIELVEDLGDEASSAAGTSEDEDYVDEYRRAKRNQRTTSSRIVHRSSSASTAASRSPSRSPSTARQRRPSSRHVDSGKPATYRKRKSLSHAADPEPFKKRAKADSPEEQAPKTATVADDPVRKFCLGKLQDVVTSIFFKAVVEPDAGTDASSDPQNEELKKTEAQEKAHPFAQELEQCVFEIFSELDKKGRKTAGPKYKERYRMLTFNLEKEDRTELRHKIASGAITPSELSKMSSADLANEQLQQQIESAHLASLRHSILEAKTAAPRAKMTHKGEEMIEDMQGYLAPGPAEPRVLTEAEEADAKQQHHDDEMMAGSTVEYQHAESPIAMDSPRSTVAPTDFPSASASGFDISEVLGDMGLPSGDMDGFSSGSTLPFKQPSASSTVPPITIPPNTSGYSVHSPSRSMSISAGGGGPSNPNTLLASALLSASQSSTSFNLDSVWGGAAEPSSLPSTSDPAPQEQLPTHQDEEIRDTDFDMFFDRGELFEPSDEPQPMETDIATVPSSVSDSGKKDEMADFEALPIVWTGNVQMPVETSSAWMTTVRARQIGGRNLGDSLATWKQLFTHSITRIDGRVAIANATKYLVDIRFNPSKELVAVALSPISPIDTDFNQLFDFLIMKGRYALVFPWANTPPDQIVGKDFYLVPFRPEDPTPEFIELLDDVHLPEQRTGNMLLGVFVLQKGRVAVQTSASPPIPAPRPVDPAPSFIPPQPQPVIQSSISSLESLIPGGLTEQHKTLLQSLMSSQAVTSSLAQQQIAPSVSHPPAIIPQQQPPFQPPYPEPPPSNSIVSPPQSFPGSSTPYTAQQPYALPPPMGGYGGYLGESIGYPPGPPAGASYGPPIHMSRQNTMEDMNGRRSPPHGRGRFQGDYDRARSGYEPDRSRRFSDDRGGGQRGSGRGRGNIRGGRGDSRGRDRGWSARGGGWS